MMFDWFKKFKFPRPTGQGMRTFALIFAAPIFGLMLAWQLYGLEPERICKTSFDLARVDGAGYLTAFQACFGLYKIALGIKDHAVIGLMAILGLGYIMMMMRELRMQGEATLPGGAGFKFRGDTGDDMPPRTPAEGAKVATEAAAAVTQELEDGEHSQEHE